MKDKIIIEADEKICKGCDTCLHEPRIVAICNLKNNLDIDLKKEQVPETYEELRHLCIGIGTKDNHIWIHSDWGKGNEYLMTHCLKFYPDGKICMDGENINEFVVAENKSPKQMWDIIKALLGAEQ